MNTTTFPAPLSRPLKVRLRSFFLMCKPRVNALIVFTALIGMLMALPEVPPLGLLFAGTLGIALVSGAAAAFNCVIEQHIDARMARTRARPLPRGQADARETLLLAVLVGGIGLAILYYFANPLTAWLTLATFLGYAVIYTIILMTGDVGPEALILFLIIFLWTPPHFWALALYRRKDYAKSGLPMLPITHGEECTRLHILLYTILLTAVSLLPFTYGMSSWLYLAAAVALNIGFLGYAIGLYRRYSDALARKTFTFSIVYLSALFAALLVDHYLIF